MNFRYADVERITGVKRLRLHHWMKEGFFQPEGETGQGHGTKNEYTIIDLYRIELLKRLISNGVHGWMIAGLLGYDFRLLRKIHEKQPVFLAIVIKYGEKTTIETLHSIGGGIGAEIERCFQDHGFDASITVNLSKIFDEVDAQI